MGRRLIGRVRAGAVLAALALLIASNVALAAAPSNGVHVDPGSPAGKEYAIPLSQARGGGGSQLFGSGITKASTSAGGGASRSFRTRSTHGSHSAGRRRSSAVSKGTRESAAQVVAAQTSGIGAASTRVLGSDHTGGIVWMLIAAGAVLLIGAIAGIALTQRGRRTAARAG